jgi:monofunctional glycosyltransferase
VSNSQDGDERAGERASVKHAFDALDRNLGRKRSFHFHVPRLPWLGLLQLAVIVLVVIPAAWVFTYRFVDPPTTVLMITRSREGERVRHQHVKFSDISPNIVRAVIAAEDSRFCSHDGFDMAAIQAAYEANQKTANVKKGKVRGGSTISQQTAKNLFLWPDRSFIRKGLEAYFTFMAEHMWSKERILQSYLNAAEWGDGVFGVQAAAQARFKVSAGELSPYQAALLAAVLPSPNKWSATSPGPYVRRRAASIEARMSAVHAQGLDNCVLGGYAGPPKRRAPVTAMPPLPELPPDVAEDSDEPVFTPLEAPIAVESIEPMMTPALSDGELSSGAAGSTRPAP